MVTKCILYGYDIFSSKVNSNLEYKKKTIQLDNLWGFRGVLEAYSKKYIKSTLEITPKILIVTSRGRVLNYKNAVETNFNSNPRGIQIIQIHIIF